MQRVKKMGPVPVESGVVGHCGTYYGIRRATRLRRASYCLETAVRRALKIAGVVVVAVAAILFWTVQDRGAEIQPRHPATDLRSHRASTVVPHVALQRATPIHRVTDDGGRNPFSFRPVRAIAPVPGVLADPPAARVSLLETQRMPPRVEAPFRFMGILRKGSGDTWAIFADCAGYTRAAKVGEFVLGTWNVIRVGAESAVVESLTGQRVVMALDGCGAGSRR